MRWALGMLGLKETTVISMREESGIEELTSDGVKSKVCIKESFISERGSITAG